MTLRVSSAANADIVEIGFSLGIESPKSARKFVAKVDNALEQLRQFPLSGVSRDDLYSGLRMLSLQPFTHLLFYVTERGDVLVTRIIDGRRDLKAALRDD